ncbi:MAG: hypothetical protein Q4F17_04675 [Eubacteriales bacterium]|nr:hypothetical protein [Eubacteriales bacterium]
MKRLFLMLLAASVLLSGCQLARPEAQAPAKDRLAGVLVTTEHLDLFDMEAYLNDHINDIGPGDHVVSDTAGYEGRIYGELTQTGRHEDGAAKYEVSFPEVEGYFWVDLRCSASGLWEPDGEYYWNSTGNGGLYDLKSGISSTDRGEESTLELTVAYWQDGPVTMFCNPIYQTADGKIYVTSGSGLSGDLALGGKMTQTLTNTVTTTVDGESRTDSTTVMVHAIHALPTEELRLVQLDEQYRILAENDYKKGSFPASLNLEPGAVCLIVQTTDGQTTTRTLCQRGDENAVYFTTQGSICIPGSVELNWSE